MRAVLVQQELGHDEARDALGAGRRVGHPGEHQVDDVVGHVVVAEGDEDLRAGDAVAAVGGGHGLGAHGAHVGAGLRLGEVHGAGPLPRHHLREVALLLLLAAVVHQQVDGALGEQRGHREGHVRRGDELLHGDADEPREAAAVVGLGERHAAPAGRDVLVVGLDEAGGRAHRVGGGVVLAALEVADAVERGDDLGDEAGVLVEDALDRVGVEPGERRELAQRTQVGQVVEHEVDVTERRSVVSHGVRG